MATRSESGQIKPNAHDHTLGSPEASLTLVEYGDYQCPSCGQAAPVVQRLTKHFGDKLYFAFRNFPLEQHEFAESAAETAEFAGDHGKFWEMHDLLYKQQRHFSDDLFPKLAAELKLDSAALTKALEAGKYERKVQADYDSGEEAGVPGTPTFFVNGILYEGSSDFNSLVEALNS